MPTTSLSRLGIAALGALLLLAWEAAGGDAFVALHVGTAAGFAWRDHVLLREVLHEGGRAAAWALLLGLAIDAWRPFLPGPRRADRLRGVLITLALALGVSAIKRVSGTSCPWDLAEFGGTASWLSHWQFGLSDGGPGHCFPSGHAAAAAAFVGVAFAWSRQRPDLARRWLIGTLVASLAFGATQVLRGAHHVSHVGWSIWLCWTLGAVLDRIALPAALAPRST